jgi:hypothetical protein
MPADLFAMSANIVALSLSLTISEPFEEAAESFWQELPTLLKGYNTPNYHLSCQLITLPVFMSADNGVLFNVVAPKFQLISLQCRQILWLCL